MYSQLTIKLVEAWSDVEASITDVRLLLILGASPVTLYQDDNLGERELQRRIDEGSVCELCVDKYREFLSLAGQIYDAQFGVGVYLAHAGEIS